MDKAYVSSATSDGVNSPANLEDVAKNADGRDPNLQITESNSHYRSLNINHITPNLKPQAAKFKPPLAPIDSLPIEILQLVFHLTMQDSRYPPYYHELLCLMSVCWRWYQAAERYPYLWTRVDVGLPQVTVSMLLSRSKGAPIYVSKHSKEEDIHLNLAMLGGHLHRVIAFDVGVDEILNEDRSCLEQAAPLLRNFALNTASYRFDALAFFGGTAPNLESIDLRGVPAAWSSPIFSGLKVLSLADMHSATSPTIYEIKFIAKNCPLLSKFELRNMLVKVVPSVNGPSVDAVALNCLETLTIRAIPPQAVDELLLLFDLPDACTISISFDDETLHTWDAVMTAGRTKVLRRYVESNESSGNPKVSVALGATDLTFQWTDGLTARTLHLGDTTYMDHFFLWSFDNRHFSLPKAVTSLQLEGSFRGTRYISRILYKLDDLESLALVASDEKVNTFLLILGTPIPDDPRTSEWPCSRLTHLEVANCYALDERVLVERLEARYNGPEKVVEALQTLKITGCEVSRETFKRMELIPNILQLQIEGY